MEESERPGIPTFLSRAIMKLKSNPVETCVEQDLSRAWNVNINFINLYFHNTCSRTFYLLNKLSSFQSRKTVSSKQTDQWQLSVAPYLRLLSSSTVVLH